MSSTGRGSVRRTDDAYETPAFCVLRLLDVWQPRDGILVEPASGSGNIVKAMPGREWVTCDVRPGLEPSPHHMTGDFLACASMMLPGPVSAVVTNPPFSLAEEFVRHARDLFPEADLAFLLRLNFLGSAGRIPLWRDLGSPDVFVLPNRPSFANGGTDSCEYSWFLWPTERRQFGRIGVLAETPREERRH